MNKEETTPIASGFFKGMAIIVLLFAITIPSTNYLINPFLFWKKDPKPFNALIDLYKDRVAPLSHIYKYFSGRPDTTQYTIIGTSHVGAGFYSVKVPHTEVIGISALSIKESLYLANLALKNNCKEQRILFIELGGNISYPVMEHKDWNSFHHLFNIEAFRLSFSILARYLPNKFALGDSAVPWNRRTEFTIEQLNPQDIKIHLPSGEEIASFLEFRNLENFRTRKQKLKVVFFISPLPAEIMQDLKIRQIISSIANQFSTAVDKMNKNSTVEFSLLNLTEQKIGVQYQFSNKNYQAGWYDSNHFKPPIANEVIEALFNHVKKPE